MKKQLIKIDQESIKKNQNSGSVLTKVQGREEITFTGVGGISQIIRDFETDRKLVITEYQTDCDGMTINYTGIIFDRSIIECLSSNIKDISINHNIDYVNLNHFPIPKYSYKYDLNSEITCDICGSKFKYGELLDDEYDVDDDYSFTDAKCPVCGTWDCCELEFEKIESIINNI